MTKTPFPYCNQVQLPFWHSFRSFVRFFLSLYPVYKFCLLLTLICMNLFFTQCTCAIIIAMHRLEKHGCVPLVRVFMLCAYEIVFPADVRMPTAATKNIVSWWIKLKRELTFIINCFLFRRLLDFTLETGFSVASTYPTLTKRLLATFNYSFRCRGIRIISVAVFSRCLFLGEK